MTLAIRLALVPLVVGAFAVLVLSEDNVTFPKLCLCAAAIGLLSGTYWSLLIVVPTIVIAGLIDEGLSPGNNSGGEPIGGGAAGAIWLVVSAGLVGSCAAGVAITKMTLKAVRLVAR